MVRRHSLRFISLLLTAVLVNPSALSVAYDGNFKVTASLIANFKRLAEQGDREAENVLGTLSSTGEGRPWLPKNEGAALEWWRKAAAKGQPEAALHLSTAYLYGVGGVDKNQTEGMGWMRKGAENGSPRAQWTLGTFYANGKIVPKDLVEAVKWWRKAADQDSSTAQNDLADAYAKGEGTPRDMVQAYKWYDIASRRIKNAATSRDEIAHFMTDKEIASAKDLAHQWKTNNLAELAHSLSNPWILSP